MNPRPSAIWCIGRNYADHAKELGHATTSRPLLFMKNPASVIGDGASTDTFGGGLSLSNSDSLIANCRIVENSAEWHGASDAVGGGVYIDVICVKKADEARQRDDGYAIQGAAGFMLLDRLK